jgi:hypothetical protein
MLTPLVRRSAKATPGTTSPTANHAHAPGSPRQAKAVGSARLTLALAPRGIRTPTARSVAWCSASIWSAPDRSGLLRLGASSIWSDPEGIRRIVWMIKRDDQATRMTSPRSAEQRAMRGRARDFLSCAQAPRGLSGGWRTAMRKGVQNLQEAPRAARQEGSSFLRLDLGGSPVPTRGLGDGHIRQRVPIATIAA